MAKHHKKGDGVKLVGSPSELINTLLKDPTERKEVTAHVTEHGSKHKQVLSALLLRRLYKLVKTIEENLGQRFIVQKGLQLTLGKHEDEMVIPLPIPINVSSGLSKKKTLKAISKAPAHEALTFTMALQVVEWSISSLTKKPIGSSKKQKASIHKRKLQLANSKMLDGVIESNGLTDHEWKE
jgi:hypothetical protein